MRVVKESSPSLSSGNMRLMNDGEMALEAAKREMVYGRIGMVVSGNAVVVFTLRGCCMGHVVKQLLLGLGVGPTIFELDLYDADSREIHDLLLHLAGNKGRQHQQPPLPAVFIGGKFLGGVETVMACHINGTLVPLLKDAGALWL